MGPEIVEPDLGGQEGHPGGKGVDSAVWGKGGRSVDEGGASVLRRSVGAPCRSGAECERQKRNCSMAAAGQQQGRSGSSPEVHQRLQALGAGEDQLGECALAGRGASHHGSKPAEQHEWQTSAWMQRNGSVRIAIKETERQFRLL